MRRISATISENNFKKLKETSKESGKSFSKTIEKMIEFGLSISDKKGNNISSNNAPNITDIGLKNTEYLIRILNISSDIFRKLLNAPLKSSGKNVDEMLAQIQYHAKNVIENRLKDI